MNIIFSEYQTDYTTYTFSYAVYCIKEGQHELPEIYQRGFLPYTGNISIAEDVFYLARGVRVNLDKYEPTSENRRVNRKIQELDIQLLPIEKRAFDTKHPAFRAFCIEYAHVRFTGGKMDENRLRYVLSRDTLTHILTFRSAEQIFGYVFAAIAEGMLHYWYGFFDIGYLHSHSLGKWMMWKTIDWAKEQQMRHVYLGTCYREKALYKIRDHKGIEFFDGARWNVDTHTLKHLCHRDENEQAPNADLFKSPHADDKQIFSGVITYNNSQ